MMTSSNGNIFRVTGPLCGEFTGPGEFPAQRPVTRSFDVFFDLRLNKRLSKQLWGWWFETSSWSLWRHCNGQIPDLKWTNGRWNHVKFPTFENWLSAKLRYLQCVCYWDTGLSSAINLYMTCWIWQNLFHVMSCRLRATGHLAVWAPLQTTLELSLRILCGI